MPSRQVLRFDLVCLLTLLGMMGCGPVATPAPEVARATALAEGPAKVTLALNWFPEAEHGGFYAAVEHGYYREAGLDVEILPGGPKAPVLQQTATGQVDFAVDNADKLLLARAQQADVVALLAPIQDSPRCIMVHEESGIETFEQLARQEGLTLAMNPGQPFAQFLTKTLDLSRARVVPYPGNISQFLLDPKFAQQGYSFSEPFVASQQGAKVRSLMVKDLGFNTYTSLLVTSRGLVTDKPELVSKMIEASRRGWATYLENPGPTNARIHRENPEMSLEVLQFGVEQLRPLCQPSADDNSASGDMTLARWTTLLEQMVNVGSLPPDVLKADEAFVSTSAK